MNAFLIPLRSSSLPYKTMRSKKVTQLSKHAPATIKWMEIIIDTTLHATVVLIRIKTN